MFWGFFCNIVTFTCYGISVYSILVGYEKGINGKWRANNPNSRRKTSNLNRCRKRRVGGQLGELCITSDSSADDFFPVEGHPVTLPAHAQKQKCGLTNIGLHTQTQKKWTNHEDKSKVFPYIITGLDLQS